MARRTEITTPEVLPDESGSERSLRPSRLSRFIGQERLKEALSIAIEAATARREPLDHILFHGPPGLGKTTLAMLLAREMGVNFTTTSGPVLEKPADLVGALTNLREGDILFIDEIHRLRPVIEEFLYPAMEDFRIEVRLSEGPRAQTMTMAVEPFTLVGATTRFRTPHRAHAGPFRDHRAARFLPAAGPGGDHRAKCRVAGCGSDGGRCARAGRPRAGNAPGGQPFAAAGARLCRSTGRGCARSGGGA